jgi:hypothetical protein
MARAWNGLMYVQDGIVQLGAVTRASGEGPWQAFHYLVAGPKLIGEYDTAAEAQRALEKLFANLDAH